MKIFTLLLASFFIFTTSIFAQSLVSTDVEYKNAVLEEYTGIHCVYCPEGHAIGNQLVKDYPGRIVLINIHQGSFANPSAGEPDFKTEFGDALAAQAGVTGYPSGTVNRHLFTGSTTSMGRGNWSPAAQQVILENSIVNVGANSSFDSLNRELTINVELYYTGDSPESTNYLNVALLQNHIFGPQTGGNAGNNYEHNHMLRHLITGQWGEEITTTTKGSFVTKTYTYTVPDNFKNIDCIVENCDIAVFVSETHQEIYSGVVIPAIDGTTLITGRFGQPEKNTLVGAPSTESKFNFSFTNALPNTENFIFTLSNTDAPNGWNNSFTINGNTYTSTGTEPFESGVETNISINITPDAESAFTTYLLTVSSASYPKAPVLLQEVYIVSNVSNLLLHNQGSWNGGTAASFENDYFAAFDYANIPSYASCNYKEFIAAGKADLLGTFDNIFFNAAWTFPSFTDENIVFFADYIDNGGNLFVAGQDIGWDTWDDNGNGTTNTKAFYTNYLNAKYKDDGSSANNSINPNTNDAIFGNLGTSKIINVYGGNNMYPDQIDPTANGHAILYYNGGTSKCSGVRSKKGDAKIVYLGFDPSMIKDIEVRKNLIKTIYNWFAGIVENINYHDVVINEFVASNDSIGGIADQDGEYDDWIELYNNTNHNINLSSTYLTDKFSEPQVWQFPEGTTIEANSYLIVWADKDTDQEGLHAKLKLKSDGEELLLTNEDGTVIDSLTFGAQTTNVAMARVPNGTGDFIFQEPTFNGTNDINAITNLNDDNFISIYPNPANDILNVQFLDNRKIYTLSITNIVGQRVNLINNFNSQNKIDISSLEGGLYILQVFSGNKLVGSTKFTVIK